MQELTAHEVTEVHGGWQSSNLNQYDGYIAAAFGGAVLWGVNNACLGFVGGLTGGAGVPFAAPGCFTLGTTAGYAAREWATGYMYDPQPQVSSSIYYDHVDGYQVPDPSNP